MHLILHPELWFFVGNKQWIWLAIDLSTGQIVGVFIGDQSRQGAQRLWNYLPRVYRQSTVCYTDFWEAYKAVIPADQQHSVGKRTGLTNRVETLIVF